MSVHIGERPCVSCNDGSESYPNRYFPLRKTPLLTQKAGRFNLQFLKALETALSEMSHLVPGIFDFPVIANAYLKILRRILFNTYSYSLMLLSPAQWCYSHMTVSLLQKVPSAIIHSWPSFSRVLVDYIPQIAFGVSLGLCAAY